MLGVSTHATIVLESLYFVLPKRQEKGDSFVLNHSPSFLLHQLATSANDAYVDTLVSRCDCHSTN